LLSICFIVKYQTHKSLFTGACISENVINKLVYYSFKLVFKIVLQGNHNKGFVSAIVVGCWSCNVSRMWL